MENLRKIIESIQNGDKDNILLFLAEFKPLLKKYAYKLNYEDAYSDLQLFMIELLKSIKCESLANSSDGGIVKYINTSVRNEYIRLYRNKRIRIQNEEYEDNSGYIVNTVGYNDDHSDIFFSSLANELTNKEFKVIKGIYYDGLTPAELSVALGQSVWNVYKLRKSAIAKLKKSLDN